jgi:FkbM family methyltransferase
MNTEQLQRLPNFLKRYGIFHGLRLGFGVIGKGGNTAMAEKSVSVPDYSQPIWMRPIRSDYSIFWQSIVREQYDLKQFPQTKVLMQRAEKLLKQGRVPVIVDGGGNIGLSLRSFARDFPFAHVVSIEPDSQNMRVLAANAREVPGSKTLVTGALASRSGFCKVVSRDRGSAGLMTEFCDESDPEAVKTFTVPELIAEVPNGSPWIIKLDIEGAQDEVFSQNCDWVSEADLIILELDDWAFPWSGSAVHFFRALSAYRFDYLLSEELVLCFRHAND